MEDYMKDGLKDEKASLLNKIINEMDSKKVSKIELARMLGVTKAYITGLINGKSKASMEKLTEIAVVLGIEVKVTF